MISAREALSSIERALQGVRKDEDRMVTMLRSSEAEAARLRAEQAEAFRQLARLKLDALARDEAIGRLDAAERRAMEALDRRRQALDRAATERDAVSRRIDELEERRIAATADRDAAADAVEALTADIEAKAATDPAWKAADARAREAEAMAVAAEEKAALAEADREKKKEPYEADSLFLYLWESGYGTAAYRGGSLTRYFDAKVARLVGFDEARANYYMLNEIPKRLAEHAARLRTAIAEASAEREAIERRALEAAGIEALEAKAAAAETAVAEAVAALEAARAAHAAADEATRATLDESGDPALRAAVEELAGAIARDDLRTLYRKALDTPSPEDETIVKRLMEIEKALVRATAEMEEIRKASVELSRKRGELERSETNFRRSGYDDPFGEFKNGQIIGSIIEGIVKGALSASNLDDAFGREYHRRPPRSGGNFGGGLRLPGPSSSRPASAPRSTPSRPSSGGFRTGGSF